MSLTSSGQERLDSERAERTLRLLLERGWVTLNKPNRSEELICLSRSGLTAIARPFRARASTGRENIAPPVVHVKEKPRTNDDARG